MLTESHQSRWFWGCCVHRCPASQRGNDWCGRQCFRYGGGRQAVWWVQLVWAGPCDRLGV